MSTLTSKVRKAANKARRQFSGVRVEYGERWFKRAKVGTTVASHDVIAVTAGNVVQPRGEIVQQNESQGRCIFCRTRACVEMFWCAECYAEVE